MTQEDARPAGRPGSLDNRRDPRHVVETEAVIRNSRQTRIGGAVIDISEHGCRIELSTGAAQPGQIVTIRLDGFESWSGVVRWAAGTQIGVEFERGLHPAIVDHIAHTHAVILVD